MSWTFRQINPLIDLQKKIEAVLLINSIDSGGMEYAYYQKDKIIFPSYQIIRHVSLLHIS